MADEHAPAPSPWGPLGLIALILIGCLVVLYVQGRLKSLDTRSLLIPPPAETKSTPAATTDESGNTYATQELQQNVYTVSPNPSQPNPQQ